MTIVAHPALAAVLFSVLLAPTAASAAVESSTLASGTASDLVVVQSRGAVDVVVRRITIPPGGSTGWHYHHGELIAVVQSGTLTRVFDDCSSRTLGAGTSFVEPAGRDHVHLGRNLGSEPVVLYVTYLVPAGNPLAIEVAHPACTS